MISEELAKRFLRDALQGMFLAVLAAYVFVLLVFLGAARRAISVRDFAPLLFGPLPTLIAYSWLLLPIGALAGATLPALARHRTALETLVIASLTAIVVALLWTIGYYLSMTLSAPSESGDLAVGIAPWLAIYCLPWTITFAFRRRSRDRSAPSPEG